MAQSLIDFGQIAQLGLGLMNLEVAQERNKIYAQNAQTQQMNAANQERQTDLEEERLRQTGAFRGFDELQKLRDHPSIAMNRDKQMDILVAQGRLLEHGLGVKVPLPNRDEMQGGYDAIDKLVKTIRTGTPEEKLAATTDAIAANPTWGKTLLDDMKKAGDVSMQMEEMHAKLEFNQARLQALNIKNSKANMAQNFFTEHMAGLSRTTQLAMDPRYKDQLAKVMSFEKPEARSIFLDMHKDFRAGFEGEAQKQIPQLEAMNAQLKEEIDARRDAISDAQSRTGEAPAEMVEEIAGYQAVHQAREAQLAFLSDPYNKEKWKAFQVANQDIRTRGMAAGKKLVEISDERTAIMREKMDAKTNTGLAESTLQELYLDNLGSGGMDDNQALGQAIKETRKRYPGVPFDANKALNPNKKGRMDIGIKLGQGYVDSQLKQIDSAQSVIDMVSDIREKIQANPSIVGKGAKIGSAFAGAGQQLRALVGLDPGAARFLNTKTRDDAESMQEILVYLQAKSMDPSGALDIKVVQEARQVVGDMSGWMTGPQQILNKLDFVSRNADRNMRRARASIRDGIPGKLGEAPQQAAPKQKPVSEMNADEVLMELFRGAQ